MIPLGLEAELHWLVLHREAPTCSAGFSSRCGTRHGLLGATLKRLRQSSRTTLEKPAAQKRWAGCFPVQYKPTQLSFIAQRPIAIHLFASLFIAPNG